MHFKYGVPLSNKYRINHTITISAALYTPDNTTCKGLLNMFFA